MRGLAGPTRAGLAVAVLLAALSLVTWRQGRALEALTVLDRVHRDLTLAEAERTELVRRIRHLESRGRVVQEARDRLGMHIADVTTEQVILDGGVR
jgi:hypothetical protein